MENNPRVKVKRFELAELASKAFKRALIPSNINAGFRRTRIWPLNYDALMHDTGCSKAFHMDGQEEGKVQAHVDAQEEVVEHEDAIMVDNIISLSQGHFYGDDDEHVNETQHNHEPIENKMEVFLPIESCEIFECDIHDDFVDHATANENVVENGIANIALGSNNDHLTLQSQVTPPSWLVEATLNMNQHNVSRTNEESMNMPSQPT